MFEQWPERDISISVGLLRIQAGLKAFLKSRGYSQSWVFSSTSIVRSENFTIPGCLRPPPVGQRSKRAACAARKVQADGSWLEFLLTKGLVDLLTNCLLDSMTPQTPSINVQSGCQYPHLFSPADPSTWRCSRLRFFL